MTDEARCFICGNPVPHPDGGKPACDEHVRLRTPFEAMNDIFKARCLKLMCNPGPWRAMKGCRCNGCGRIYEWEPPAPDDYIDPPCPRCGRDVYRGIPGQAEQTP